jgi:hypothetical protein
MAYLASTNSVFGARNTAVKPNPVQYCYMQNVDIVQSGNAFLTKRASFNVDTASLCWTTRFNAVSGENGTFFSVQNSKFYNDTTGIRRLGFNGTGSYDCNATWTGYVDAGDVLGLCAYSAATGNTLKAFFGSCLIATLISATAPRIGVTPVIPPS